MENPVNYVLITFEGNINHVYTQGLKNYFQAIGRVEQDTDKLDMTVSNSRYIV